MERDADIENRLVDAEGWRFRGGVGENKLSGMDGESSMETYTLPYVRRIASGNSLCDS